MSNKCGEQPVVGTGAGILSLLESLVEKVGWYVPVERVIFQKYMKW